MYLSNPRLFKINNIHWIILGSKYTGGQSDLATMQPSIEPQTTHHQILYVTHQVMERCTKRCNKWISLHLMSNKYFGSIWESWTNEIFPENSWTGKRPFVFANVKSILHCLLSSKTKPLKPLPFFFHNKNFNLSVFLVYVYKLGKCMFQFGAKKFTMRAKTSCNLICLQTSHNQGWWQNKKFKFYKMQNTKCTNWDLPVDNLSNF